MTATLVTPEDLVALRPDLEPLEAQRMVQGAIARAAEIAPCIKSESFAKLDAANGILLDVLLRRVDAGTGSVTHQQAGPYSTSTDVRSTLNLFTQQERLDLAALCKPAGAGGRTIFTAPITASADPLTGVVINGPADTGPDGL